MPGNLCRARRCLLPGAAAITSSKPWLLPQRRLLALALPPRPPLPPSNQPSAETVQQLAESARVQKKMWDVFVPERGIRFGDTRFWVLLSVVVVLHAINTYRDANAPKESDLPHNVVRRLPDGHMLMDDGSIKIVVEETQHGHTLHKAKGFEGRDKPELVLDKLARKLKDAA